MEFVDLPKFGLFCTFLFCCFVGLVAYRLYLHPLAKFPGPKLAALTFWYEYYYDVHKRGRFTWQIKALHEQYGPIIRINPYELHIDDPDFYEEIYTNNTRRRDKHLWWAHVDGEGQDMFQTMNHDLHRSRKGPVSPFFSKRSVMALEPLIWEKTTKLVHRIKKAMERSEILDLSAAYAALTGDVISQYSFGECDDSLDKDDFGRWWLDFLHNGVQMHPLFRQFPWLVHWLMKLPEALFVRMNPYGTAVLEHDRMCQRRVRKVVDEKANNKAPAQRTVVHNLLDSSLPPDEKAVNRLAAESAILLGAGTETTARALAYISFVLTDKPEMLAELRTELKTVMPRPQSEVQLTQLEHLPYLTGIIQEGLRLSFGVVGRLPRVIRGESLHYKEWTIPDGTPVSESAYLIHLNPTIFPDPHKFEPKRWIGNKRLERYLVAFSKGTRSCVGMNLAYAEIYAALAAVHRAFDLELFETDKSDVDIVHDYFIGMPKLDSKGVRTKVVRQLES